MMGYRWVFFFILLFVSLNLFSQDIPIFRIDPDKAYGGTVSEYFENVEYTPLETTKESLFGTLHQYYFTDSSIVIYDKDTRSVLFFRKNGKFITRIYKYKTLNAAGVSYDILSKRIIIWFNNSTNSKNENIFYSMTGKVISNGINFKRPFFRSEPVLFGDEYFGVHNWYIYENSNIFRSAIDSVFFLFNVYKKEQLYKSMIPVSLKDNIGYFLLDGGIGECNNVLTHSEEKYIALDFLHTVYKISKDTSLPEFKIIFPKKYVVSKDLLFSKDIRYIDSIRQRSKWFNDNTIRSVSNINRVGGLILFTTKGMTYSIYNGNGEVIPHNFIYNTKVFKLSALERITPDHTSYYLPALDPAWLSFRGFTINNRDIYSYISSLKMFAARDANKHRNPQYPPILQEYFKTQNRKSNPVIVRMRLRDVE